MADVPVNTNLESPLNGLAVAAAAPATAQDRGGGRPITEEDGQEEHVPGGGRGETQNTKQTFQCHTCDDNINVQILVQYPNTFDLSDDVLKRSYRLDYD